MVNFVAKVTNAAHHWFSGITLKTLT